MSKIPVFVYDLDNNTQRVEEREFPVTEFDQRVESVAQANPGKLICGIQATREEKTTAEAIEVLGGISEQ